MGGLYVVAEPVWKCQMAAVALVGEVPRPAPVRRHAHTMTAAMIVVTGDITPETVLGAVAAVGRGPVVAHAPGRRVRAPAAVVAAVPAQDPRDVRCRVPDHVLHPKILKSPTRVFEHIYAN